MSTIIILRPIIKIGIIECFKMTPFLFCGCLYNGVNLKEYFMPKNANAVDTSFKNIYWSGFEVYQHFVVDNTTSLWGVGCLKENFSSGYFTTPAHFLSFGSIRHCAKSQLNRIMFRGAPSDSKFGRFGGNSEKKVLISEKRSSFGLAFILRQLWIKKAPLGR